MLWVVSRSRKCLHLPCKRTVCNTTLLIWLKMLLLRSWELISIQLQRTSVSLRLRTKASIAARRTRNQFQSRSRRAIAKPRKTPTLVRRDKTKERTKLCKGIRLQGKLLLDKAQHKEPVVEIRALFWTLARLQQPLLELSTHSNSLQLELMRKRRRQWARSLQALYLRVVFRDFWWVQNRSKRLTSRR